MVKIVTKEVCHMNSKLEKVLRGSVFGALLVLFLMLPGCPVSDSTGLVSGSAYEVELQVQDDGTLYAVSMEAKCDGEQDGEHDGDNEDEDGEDGDNQEQDGESDADEEGDADDEGDGDDDGEEDGDNDGEGHGDGEHECEDVETGFSAQVDSVAADCSSFTVFGSLIVVLEEDDDHGEDVEQEGENGEGQQMVLALDVPSQDPATVGPTLDQGEGQDDGDDEPGICDLTPGMWIEAEGEYEADGIFHAEEIEIADEAETEIESVIGNLTDGTFTMLGLTITYDDSTIVEGGDEDEDEGEADEDDEDEGEDDGDDCEQEGENEGENAGC
jgi:hypothetical protein